MVGEAGHQLVLAWEKPRPLAVCSINFTLLFLCIFVGKVMHLSFA